MHIQTLIVYNGFVQGKDKGCTCLSVKRNDSATNKYVIAAIAFCARDVKI